MKNKDLNLSLHHPLVKPQRPPAADTEVKPKTSRGSTQVHLKIAGSHEPPVTEIKGGKENIVSREQPASENKERRSSEQTSRLLPTLFFIVLLAAAISVLTTLWLNRDGILINPVAITTTPASTPAARPASTPQESMADFDAGIAQGFEQLSQALEPRIQSLEQQIATLEQLLQRLSEQQQAANLQVLLQNQAILAELEASRSNPAISDNDWSVNLGAFSDRTSALTLQKQMQQFGYPAEISAVSLQDKTMHRVQIPGFLDRDKAEAAAQNIMKETNMDSLWVWKSQKSNISTP